MVIIICDSHEGYGRWGNAMHRVNIKELTPEEQKKYIKKLWEEDSFKYFQWKNRCIRANSFPELFGTRDNPIRVDESKL